MNNLVLDRIKRALQQSKSITEAKKDEQVEEIVDHLLTPGNLEKLLMSELVESRETTTSEDKVFNNIESFVSWLIPNRNSFTSTQLVPLTTLIQARELIEIGCGCKRNNRIKQANDYYQTFWMQNKNTDLPSKVLEVGKFNSVTFSRDGSVLYTVSKNTPIIDK